MKKFISTLWAVPIVFVALGALMMVSAEADARGHASGARGHHSGARSHNFHRSSRVGVFVGAPVIVSPGWYYPGPYYVYGPYYSPFAQDQAQPMVYVEQQTSVGAVPPEPQAQPYWYYCQDLKTYYPYVQDCTTPWQLVVPYAPQ